MNPPSSLSSVANVILCGISPLTSVFVRTISAPNPKIKICGFWSPPGFSHSIMNGLKRIGGSFEDIFKEPECDFVFLCHAPQVQYKLLRALASQHNSREISKGTPNCLPIVILIPPVSPCYSQGMLLDCGMVIGIAMPLRKILPVSLLSNHLKNLREQKPLDTARNASGLPSHWTFGVPRSFHARLSTTSCIKTGIYSWLCEPGVMGGGLLNLYGAGLIDLTFILTGGLKFTAVNCISRVFDWKLTDDPNCIRRVSAEDYVLITGELESTECGTHCESEGPVAVFCLSSELPQVDPVEGMDANDECRLQIELIGSSGRFVISDQGHQISWTPVQPRRSRVHLQNASNEVENEELFSDDRKAPSCLQNGDLDDSLDNLKPCVNGSSPGKMFDDYNSSHAHNSALVHVTTMQNTETATLNTKAFNLASGSKSDNIHPLRFAWSQWVNQLVGSIHSDRSKLGLDALLATPEHWSYIQRVLNALEKSARLRCWVDVATCERT